ncbi:MAG: AAA family ATPase [Thermoleophilia bacterium]|nr:AAA family ATPase [Thermoleophilia bacterium]
MSTCPSCGFEAPAGSRFCPSCGAALASEVAGEEMLKLVTVLFADVVGSTARAERLHPEDVRALMTDYFAAMAEEIRAEGGTLEKFVGDAIMAVFGVPAAREDDALRAVRAARRMLERLRRWNEERDPEERLQLRIGLNTGEVIASGAPGGDLLVTGDAVNVAARLQQVAEPGAVVVGERTARAVRTHFQLAAIEQRTLRGRAEPVAAWVVTGERTVPEPRGLTGLGVPLVGRDHELASLNGVWDRVKQERHPALVTLVGDAGVGKSRLVREFVSPLEAVAKVLVGRCLPHGEGVTLSPLAEMLKAQAVVLDTDRADAAAARIVRLVEETVEPELLADPRLTAAALAATLGLRLPGDPLGSLDPRERYRELVDAWRVLLASLARHAPVVAVVEDLHWADPTMLDTLDELAERLEGAILFLCTARADLLRSRPDWGGGRRSFSSLPLDPLSTDESRRLVASLLDVEELPEGARRLILERSEGNPFFLEEIVRRLVDDGLLARADGRWRVQAGIDRIEIPDNVHAVILARLDLLAPEERRVAQRAAVVGRFFWDGAVARLARVDDLDAVLRTLRRREFVVERLASSIAGQREYAFKHVLIRDVAYESLPRKERGRAHAATAAWIQDTSGERSGEVTELLAHHYDAAYSFLGDDDLRTRARGLLLEAATNAHRRFAIQQSERFARRAVELSRGSAERVEALEALGDLYYLAYHGDAAWRAYGDALAELADAAPPFARLAAKAALFGARWIGTMRELPEIDDVRRLIDAGLGAAPERGPERTLLLVDRGFLISQREGRRDQEADDAVREAAAAAEELGDADLLSAALDLVQAHAMLLGRYGEMYREGQRRNALVPRMSDVKEIGDTYAMAAWSALHLGRYREAETHASACIVRSHGIDAGSYLHGLTWRVAARFRLGDWDGSLADHAELERVAPLARGEAPAGYTTLAYASRALTHVRRGEHDEADRYVDAALRYFRGQRLPAGRSLLHSAPLALALAQTGRFEEALALLPFAPRTGGAGATLEALCEIAAARERWDEAPGLVSAAREEAEAGGLLALPLVADRLEGRAAAAGGDVRRGAELLARSADGFAELEARWEEAWSRLLLAELAASTDAGIAERHLGAALRVFEQLGSVRELERSRALEAVLRPTS